MYGNNKSSNQEFFKLTAVFFFIKFTVLNLCLVLDFQPYFITILLTPYIYFGK